MSLKHILILLVLSMVLVNAFIRIRVMKSYKKLKDKDLQMDPKLILNKKKREQYFRENPSKHQAEVEQFSRLLNNLIKYVFLGLVVLIALFAYIYHTQ